MAQLPTADLLKQPLSQLNVSEIFLTHSIKMGFRCLEDILSCPPAELVWKPGFSYHWLQELVELLKESKLLHLLQPMPGKNFS